MRVLVATTNLGKIKEFQDIFPSKIEILSLKDLNICLLYTSPSPRDRG